MIDVIRFLHHNIVRPQRAFIVHGHDTDVLEELKEFIQSLLGWPAPIILQEMPSKTSTIIEKFEEYAAQIDMIFVLMTPDDIAEEKTKHTSRARQNVILELGYFMGRLGRHSNRTFILKKGAIELPSDISGIIYIDISDGIFNASEKILHELQYLMHS